MSDRLRDLLVFAIVAAASAALAALPHIPAYSALVSWTVALLT